MWLEPAFDGPPCYAAVTASFETPGFVLLASGREPAPLSLRSPASLAVALLAAGERAGLSGAAFVHVSVVRGGIELSVDGATTAMADGDTARVVDARRLDVLAGSACQVLVWLMD